MPDSEEEAARRSRFRTVWDLVRAGCTVRLRRYEIADRSMETTLHDGDWVVAIARPRGVSIGDVVVCDLPGRSGFEIVKRITAIDPSTGALWIEGDADAVGGVDSRSFGAIDAAAVTARVVLRYRPRPMTLIR